MERAIEFIGNPSPRPIMYPAQCANLIRIVASSFRMLAMLQNTRLLLLILKWFGTATGIAGALIVAANVGVSPYGFIALIISSITWIVSGFMMRDLSIVSMYLVFTGINFFGLIRWLL